MKKHLLNTLLLISLAISMVSCNENQEEIEKKFLTNVVQEMNIDKQYEWMVILPGVGCHGCIQEAEYFMKNHVKNQKILFVLTNITSLKILQQKTGIKVNDYPNVYIDRNSLFKLSTDNAIYPYVIQVNEGKYLQHTFQSPKTAAFHNLEKHVDNISEE